MSPRSFLCSVTASMFLTIVAASETRADEKKEWKPSFSFGTAIAYPIQVVTPQALQGKPGPAPAILQSFNISVAISERWSLSTKLALFTPFTTVQLAPQFHLGASVRVYGPVAVAASVLYRYTPQWASLPRDAQVVGGALGPVFILPSKIRILVAGAAIYNATNGSFSLASVTEVLLPF